MSVMDELHDLLADDGMNAEERDKETFFHVSIPQDDGGQDMGEACMALSEALDLRDKYKNVHNAQSLLPKRGSFRGTHSPPNVVSSQSLAGREYDDVELSYRMVEGIVNYAGQSKRPVSYQTYCVDFQVLFSTVEENGPARSMCRTRLKILEHKYNLHMILNSDFEERYAKLKEGGGMYATMKVDNSVRLSTAMSASMLLSFIKDKVENHGEDKVATVEGETITLNQFMARHNLDSCNLTVENLGLQPDAWERFHRFDIFSRKFSRGGEGSVELLHLMLKRGGYLQGRYYGELSRQLLSRKRQYVATEYKLPIFGTSASEWQELVVWLSTHKISSPSNRWIIQVPRIEEIRRIKGFYACETLQDQLDNIFLPIWKASVSPRQNPELAELLKTVVAFNVISDESSRGQMLPEHRPPREWPWDENPPDIYFLYYIWANVYAINQFRMERGMNTFQFRPNCGEMGDLTHLVSAFLLADSINHGIRMQNSPVLQYLFYMKQIGIVCSPLANNALFLKYNTNPFPQFFRRGLRVSLSTDDPLHFHHTNEPVNEEYGTASKLYKLTAVDLCEIARNSVLISGFEHSWRQRWLGADYLKGSEGNNVTTSHVPAIRLRFREEVLKKEKSLLSRKVNSVRKRNVAQGPLLRTMSSVSTYSSELPETPRVEVWKPGIHPGYTEDHVNFMRVDISAGPAETTKATVRAAEQLALGLDLRHKYVTQYQAPPWNSVSGIPSIPAQPLTEILPGRVQTKYSRGVYMVVDSATQQPAFRSLPTISEFYDDLSKLHDVVEDSQVKTLAFTRLRLLEAKFGLHIVLNRRQEETSSEDDHRDFYQSYKVDTHVRMTAGMTAKQLLAFIVEKARLHRHDVVGIDELGTPVTLADLLTYLQMNPMNLTAQHVDLSYQKLTQSMRGSQPFEVSTMGGGLPKHGAAGAKNTESRTAAALALAVANDNDKLAPPPQTASLAVAGRSATQINLYSLLLQTDNYMSGRYFAEIIKTTFKEFQLDAFTFTENRLVFFPRSRNAWTKLALWATTHGVFSVHNRWVIQISLSWDTPAACDIGGMRNASSGSTAGFAGTTAGTSTANPTGTGNGFASYVRMAECTLADALQMLFGPLFDVTRDPTTDPILDYFLRHISGFDFGDSEVMLDPPFTTADPAHIPINEVNYSTLLYYLWANVTALNLLRSTLRMPTFTLKPNCGEIGSVSHLVSGFLTCSGINHGLQLQTNPALEYLYYLGQVPIAMSPISNNHTGASEYLQNPFPLYFRKGLNVSLASDQPLHLHHTQEPLVEEYSVASKIWKLSPSDMCEVARNSVLQCGFGAEFKARWLGPGYFLASTFGNFPDRSHLPHIRVAYRFETYHAECTALERLIRSHMRRALLNKDQELRLIHELHISANLPPHLALQRVNASARVNGTATGNDNTSEVSSLVGGMDGQANGGEADGANTYRFPYTPATADPFSGDTGDGLGKEPLRDRELELLERIRMLERQLAARTRPDTTGIGQPRTNTTTITTTVTNTNADDGRTLKPFAATNNITTIINANNGGATSNISIMHTSPVGGVSRPATGTGTLTGHSATPATPPVRSPSPSSDSGTLTHNLTNPPTPPPHAVVPGNHSSSSSAGGHSEFQGVMPGDGNNANTTGSPGTQSPPGQPAPGTADVVHAPSGCSTLCVVM